MGSAQGMSRSDTLVDRQGTPGVRDPSEVAGHIGHFMVTKYFNQPGRFARMRTNQQRQVVPTSISGLSGRSCISIFNLISDAQARGPAAQRPAPEVKAWIDNSRFLVCHAKIVSHAGVNVKEIVKKPWLQGGTKRQLAVLREAGGVEHRVELLGGFQRKLRSDALKFFP